MTDTRAEAIEYLNQYCAGENFYPRGTDTICCDNPSQATWEKIWLMSNACEIGAFPEIFRGTLEIGLGDDISGLKKHAENEPQRKADLEAALDDLNKVFASKPVLTFDGEFIRSKEFFPGFNEQKRNIDNTLDGLTESGAVDDYIMDHQNRRLTIIAVDREKLKAFLAAAPGAILPFPRPAAEILEQLGNN